jgi:hypothetical protein
MEMAGMWRECENCEKGGREGGVGGGIIGKGGVSVSASYLGKKGCDVQSQLPLQVVVSVVDAERYRVDQSKGVEEGGGGGGLEGSENALEGGLIGETSG